MKSNVIGFQVNKAARKQFSTVTTTVWKWTVRSKLSVEFI